MFVPPKSTITLKLVLRETGGIKVVKQLFLKLVLRETGGIKVAMFLKLIADVPTTDVPLNSAITLKSFSTGNWRDKSCYVLKCAAG